MGWFFWFKLYLNINELEDLMEFYLSQGNVDERNVKIVQDLTKRIFGKLFGYKGYLSKSLFSVLF